MHSKVIPFDMKDVVQIRYDTECVEGTVEYVNKTRDKILIRSGDSAGTSRYEWVNIYSKKLFPDNKSKYIASNQFITEHQNTENNIFQWNIELNKNNQEIMYFGLLNKIHQSNLTKILCLIQRTIKYSLPRQIQINTKLNKIKNSYESNYYLLILCGYIRHLNLNMEIPRDIMPLLCLYLDYIHYNNIMLQIERNELQNKLNDEFKTQLFESKQSLKNTPLHYVLKNNCDTFFSLFDKYRKRQNLKNGYIEYTNNNGDDDIVGCLGILRTNEEMEKLYKTVMKEECPKLEELVEQTVWCALSLSGYNSISKNDSYYEFEYVKNYHLKTIKNSHVDRIPITVKQDIQKEFIENKETFNYESINNISKECGILYLWIEAQLKYDDCLGSAQNFRDTVFEIKDRLNSINKKLNKNVATQKQINSCEKKLKSLRQLPHKLWNKYGIFLYDGYNNHSDKDHLEIRLNIHDRNINGTHTITYDDIDSNSQYELYTITFTNESQ